MSALKEQLNVFVGKYGRIKGLDLMNIQGSKRLDLIYLEQRFDDFLNGMNGFSKTGKFDEDDVKSLESDTEYLKKQFEKFETD